MTPNSAPNSTPNSAPNSTPNSAPSHQQQHFISDAHLHFSLRQSKRNVPTIIYAVLTWEGKTYRINTSVRTYPAQWDRVQQRAVVSVKLQDVDNHNNMIANEVISNFSVEFYRCFSYFCNVSKDSLTEGRNKVIEFLTKGLSKRKINPNKNTMADKSNDATSKQRVVVEWINEHLDRKVKSGDIQGSSREAYKDYTSRFNKYLTKLNVEGDWADQTFEFWRDFKSYLQGQEGGNNAKARTFRMIRKWVTEIALEQNICLDSRISKIEYKIEDTPQNYAPLTYDEVKVLLSLAKEQLLNEVGSLDKAEKLLKYRDYFCMQCLCGARVSDMHYLFADDDMTDSKGNKVLLNKDGKRYFRFIPKKETKGENPQRYHKGGKVCIIPFSIFDEIGTLYERRKGSIKREMGQTEQSRYNQSIRLLCKIAGLTRKEPYNFQDEEGKWKIQNRSISTFISSHDARHTFITNCIRVLGLGKDKIIEMTGHHDTQYIDKVYANLTEEDRTRNLEKALMGNTTQKVEVSVSAPDSKRTTLPKDCNEAKSVLNSLGVDVDTYIDVDDYDTLVRMLSVTEYTIIGGYNADKIFMLKDIYNHYPNAKERKLKMRELIESWALERACSE